MKNSAIIRISVLALVMIGQLITTVASAQEERTQPLQGTLYTSNFSSLTDGDFPPDLNFRGGGMQIDNSLGDAMLRFQGGSWFHIPLNATLPKSFVIEFDYHTNESYAVLFVSAFDAAVSGGAPSYSGYRQGQFNFFSIANTSVGVAVDAGSQSLPKANAQNSAFKEGLVAIRLEVRDNQAKIFVDGNQVLIHPSAKLHRTNVIEFFYGSMGAPGNGFVGNIRILSL